MAPIITNITMLMHKQQQQAVKTKSKHILQARFVHNFQGFRHRWKFVDVVGRQKITIKSFAESFSRSARSSNMTKGPRTRITKANRISDV